MQTITNTSKTDFVLPSGLSVPAGQTVAMPELALQNDQKNPNDHSLVDFLTKSGVLRFSDGSAVVSSTASMLPAGSVNEPNRADPVPNSAAAPNTAPAEAPPEVKVVKGDDGTHEVHLDGSPVVVGLSKREAEKQAAELVANPS